MELANGQDYSKCSKFSLYVTENILQGSDLISLQELHQDLENPRYLRDFARELRKKQPVPLDLIEQITHLDTDERVVEKVLHEVRVYIYRLLNGSQYSTEIEANKARLLRVQEEVTKVRPTETIVKGICERLIEDLQRLQASQYHCNSEEFCEKLQELRNKLLDIQIIRKPKKHWAAPELQETKL